MHFDDSICSMRGRNFRKEWTRDNFFNGEAQLQSRHLLYTEQWTVMYFHNISYGENLLTFSLGGIQQLKAVYYTVEVHNFDLQEKNYFNFEVTTNFV